MKKILLSLITVFLLFSSVLIVPVSANNNFDINIDVKIKQNGDAVVTQKWFGTFNEGTENYLPIGNLPSGMDIRDFSVWDKDGHFEYIDDWDIDASRSEKARKCGIVEEDDHYELCYGIGEYGNNEYYFRYTIVGLVGAYDDKDGFNFQFVNPGMNCYPTDVLVTIESENGKKFNENNCGIWAFGFQGSINFVSNRIVAKTSTPLENEDRYVNIVVGFKKGLLKPTRQGKETSFESLLNKAKEGSSYGTYKEKDEDFLYRIAMIGVFVAFVIGSISYLIISIIRKINLKKFAKKCEYYREIPCNKDLNMAFSIVDRFKLNKKESSIIGACLLDLILKKSLVPMIDKDTSFMGKVKKTVDMKIETPPNEVSPSTELYNILVKAAGADGILQEKELKKYCKAHPNIMRDFINKTKQNGEVPLEAMGPYKKNISKCSEEVKSRVAQVIGLKKYLQDFSLISERSVEEVDIWEDLLVYATLYDIAEEVMKDFKKIYPNLTERNDDYMTYIGLSYAYRNITYSAMLSGEAAQRARSSGKGGSSSLGGGGGFSGGGFGGGSR